jgi:RNA polymerase sigma factor (sigma-70 family)
MAAGQLDAVLRHLRRLADDPAGDGLSDRTLLERFARRREEAAFEILVRRHGPLVLAVCRRVLGHEHDAEDAFQAAFLVLARKVGCVRWQESVATWLYEVAYRTALKARAAQARRRKHERAAAERRAREGADPPAAEDWQAAVDAEVARLPAKYRAPVVLCYLQGRSHTEAARQLGWPEGTVKGRLARARELLRGRLARRGLALSPALAALALSPALVPAALAGSTAQAARAFATGTGLAAGVIPDRAGLLAQGMLKAMVASKVKLGILLLLLAGLLGLGAGLSGHRVLADKQPPARQVGPPPQANNPTSSRPALVRRVLKDCYGDPLPAGAFARLGTVRLRQGNQVQAVAFSPDRKTLASTGHYPVVRIWDRKTGQEIRRLRGPRGLVADYCWMKSLAYSRDGKYLAAGGANGDRTIYVWEAETGKEARRLKGHDGNVTGLAFTPDGKHLISSSSDRTLRLWEVATGKKVRQFEGHGAWVRCMALSRDGKTLASGADDKTVRLWDVASGKQKGKSLAHPQLLKAVAFTHDGKTLATGCWDNVIRLWDVATGRPGHELKGHLGAPCSLKFFVDGKRLASGSWDGSVRLWDVAKGKEIRQFKGHHRPVPDVALSEDEKTIASGAWDGTVRLWDVTSGKELLPTRGHRNAVTVVAVSPDGKTLATGSEDNSIGLWDLATGQEIRRLGGQSGPPPLLKRGQPAQSLGPLGRPDSLAFSPDGKTLYASCWDHTIYAWETATGKLRHAFHRQPGGVRSAIAADGKRVASGDLEKTVILWDTANGKEVRRFVGKGEQVGCVALSPDGKLLAAGYHRTGWVYLWNAVTGKEVRHWKGALTYLAVVAFSPDGKRLITAGADYDSIRRETPIQLWDVASGKEVRRFTANRHVVVCALFSPDGQTLASTGDGNEIVLWEVATGRRRGRFRGHQGPVWSLSFAPDGTSLVSASQDTTALVWDVTGLRQGGRLPAGEVTAREVAALWTDLAAADAGKAYRARWALALGGRRSVPFLEKQLRPVAAADSKLVRRLILDLDNKKFAVRKQAMAALEKLGDAAGPVCREALSGDVSPETRQRLEQLLQKLAAPSAGQLQALRAIEVLEQIGTSEARKVLAKLAGGAEGVRLTRTAKGALDRLGKRSPK